MGIFFHYLTTGGTSMGELQPKLQTDSIQKQERTDNWFARAMNIRIGIIPLPIYILLFLLITVFVMSRDVKSDILTSIAVMSFFGFTFGQVGKSIPIVRSIGGPAILATFIPSAVVYYHLLPKDIITSTTEFTESSNFLYLFIAGIVVGSILGMKRETLVKAFVKIFIPLIAGSIAAAIVGLCVGTLLGLGFQHTLLYIVVPIMAGVSVKARFLYPSATPILCRCPRETPLRLCCRPSCSAACAPLCYRVC